MALTTLITAALLGQSAFSLAVDNPGAQRQPDVAYEELAAGRAEEAVRKLEAAGAAKSNDPATLINLGTAYAGVGRIDKAIVAYRAAADGERYELELADGSWMDSREAARTALGQLLARNAQASR